MKDSPNFHIHAFVKVLICAIIFYRHCAVVSGYSECRKEIQVDFDSLKVFPTFNFWANWTWSAKHYWYSNDFDFESRYDKLYALHNQESPQVKVFLIPFSHNDPGWLETFEGYFYSVSKSILSNVVSNLVKYENMTFVWSEIAFLSKWWDEASSSQKHALKQLAQTGRFEILTGGWVMSDEATTSLFAIINQLVEGHQWVAEHLQVTPISSISIDPFGHSSSMPYILKKSGLTGMMIQRNHYGWKNWFAEHRKGDFMWYPRWSSDVNDAILCHNAHYDLYPTKHSCGPHTKTCMEFDFRRIPDKREEQNAYMKFVEETNLEALTDKLLGQYRRTASLTRHNLVLTGLGGDFRWELPLEWDQQHENYQRLAESINSNQNMTRTSVQFSTLTKYLQAVSNMRNDLPAFRGDFFPYSDILFAHAPAYWTGYYGTRPFWKKLSREVEDELFKAELLFTFAYNLMEQRNYKHAANILFGNYDNLVLARRSVALFQHHDGITGTSPRRTMVDYARKLAQAQIFSRHIQKIGIEAIWRNELGINIPPLSDTSWRKSALSLPTKLPIKLYQNASVSKKILLFNSLAWKRSHLVRLEVQTPNVTVIGSQGEIVLSQISTKVPLNNSEGNTTEDTYEILFVANLPPLSVVTYEVRQARGANAGSAVPTQVSCKNCNSRRINSILKKNIVLSNDKLTAFFNSDDGLLKNLTSKSTGAAINVQMSLGRYNSLYGSGAYLLNLSPYSTYKILLENSTQIYLVQGPVASEVVIISDKLKLTTWIVHGTGSPELQSVVFMSMEVGGEQDNSRSLGEYFLRLESNLNTSAATATPSSPPQPVFYTDTNGLAVEKRVALKALPYQANHFPVTNFAFLQDESTQQRLSILVDRAHGASSMASGRIELIFNRRALFHDARGVDEGVTDPESAISNYILGFESLPQFGINETSSRHWEPSIQIQKLSKCLNHPPALFLYDGISGRENGKFSFFRDAFPQDVFLLNFRTISGRSASIKATPSTQSLMILQRLGHYTNKTCQKHTTLGVEMMHLQSKYITKTNLVGTEVTPHPSITTHRFNDTNSLPVGQLHELHAYLVDF